MADKKYKKKQAIASEDAQEPLHGESTASKSRRKDGEFHPPDGGWGWVVCFTSMWTNGTVFGIINTFGIVYVHMRDLYAKDDPDISFKTSWVGSVCTGTTFLMCMFASIVSDRLGIRKTAMFGGMLGCAALVGSAFVDQLYLLYLTYGILLGVGSSCTYAPSLVILGHYFRKHMGLVNGLVTFGSALFTIALSLSLPKLLAGIGLRYTFIFLAGLNFLLVLCALTFKPLIKKETQLSSIALSRESIVEHVNECCSWTKKYLNVDIWKNRGYVIWALSNGVSLFGYFVPFVHLVKHTKDLFPEADGSLLVMCMSITSGVGRIAFGKVADLACVNRLRMQQFAFLILGVTTMCIPFANNFASLIVITLVMGICDGIFICLLGPIAFDLVGPSGASQALGFLFGIFSLPMTVGPPIAVMPRKKNWRRSAAGRRRMEGYRLPEADTGEDNLVNKAEGEDLVKITKNDGYRITESGTEDDDLSKKDRQNRQNREDDNLVKKFQEHREDDNLVKKIQEHTEDDDLSKKDQQKCPLDNEMTLTKESKYTDLTKESKYTDLTKESKYKNLIMIENETHLNKEQSKENLKRNDDSEESYEICEQIEVHTTEREQTGPKTDQGNVAYMVEHAIATSTAGAEANTEQTEYFDSNFTTVESYINSVVQDVISEIMIQVCSRSNDQANEIRMEEEKTICKGKLKPGKMPFIRKCKTKLQRKCSNVKVKECEALPESKSKLSESEKESNVEPEIEQNVNSDQAFVAHKPHNRPNLKEKFMPRSKPCSEPRPTRQFQTNIRRHKSQINFSDLKKVHATEKEKDSKKPNETTSAQHSNPRDVQYVQGNFHQGHPQFGENSGRQCVANSVVSMLFSKIKNLSNWNSTDLDLVLCTGNELYTYLQRSSTTTERYLLVSELPGALDAFGKTFCLNFGESISGFVNKNVEMENEHIMCIDAALQTVFSQYESSFVTFGEATFAVIESSGRYCIFDSHSRSATGFQVPDGSSVLIQYNSLFQVYERCLNLATSMNLSADTQFEVTGVTINSCNGVQAGVSESQPMDVDRETEQNVSIHDHECISDSEGEFIEMGQTDGSIHYHESISDSDGESIEIGQTDTSRMLFFPVTLEVCKRLSNQLGIQYGYPMHSLENDVGVEIAEPCSTVPIDGDGNCFFRCLSYAISGKQNNHRKIRLAVVKHLREHADIFQPFLRSSTDSVDEYIQKSRMWYVGTWATEVEILAAADLLRVDICTFSSNRWLRHSSSQLSKDRHVPDTAIYLNHVLNTHYEVVTCAKTVGVLRDSCTFHGCDKDLKMNDSRKRTAVESCDSFICSGDQSPFQKLKIDETEVRKSRSKQSSAKAKREYIRAKRALQRNDNINEHSNAKQRKLAKERERYHSDAEFREKKAERYTQNPDYRESVKTKSIEKYSQNLKHKESVKTYSINKYATNPEHKQSVKTYIINKYASNPEYKESRKSYSIKKYAENPEHRESVQTCSIDKYAKNEEHRESVKTYSIDKYAKNEEHRESVKTYSIDKYAKNEEHRESVKTYSIDKYAKNEEHRESVKTYNINKYAQDEDYRANMKEKNKARSLQNLDARRKIDIVQNDFKKKISEGPEFVCAVCHRRLFKKQVIECKRIGYQTKDVSASISQQCITETYLHKCTENCDDDCGLLNGPTGTLWICHTCHRKVLHGKMPAEAVVNNLDLKPIPNDLQCLNDLEQHLISLNIPFMKMMALPKGGQHGVHGPIVSVPSDIQKSTSILPRFETDDEMIRVKLKRKLTYKSHYKYRFVNKAHIQKALSYLQGNNELYKDVHFNENWVNPLPVIDEGDEHDESDTDVLAESEKVQTEADEQTDNEEPENEQGLLMDTCLQPVDIGQEFLDQHFDKISCVAPAEENQPVRILMDKHNEAKSFPMLFPSGAPTFHDDREERITLGRYLHTRLMNADSRFARNTDYIFYAQYLSELDQVMSNVSIAMRKGSSKIDDRTITSDDLTDTDSLHKILKSDDGYKFLKPIRGTPPFWQSAQKDLFAMLRQLGIPTWFCSFSSADLRWPEMIDTILREEADPRKADELDWAERCSILRQNPVTAARMFDQRFHCFLKEVILSPAEPIGKIKDYFYRVEFQQRGSPHTHCLFWVENAPKIDKDSDDKVKTFIDQFVTCEMPSGEHDEELHSIVNSVQKHSKRHSKSCRKKGTICRFHFPRPPSVETFIARAGGIDHKETNVTEEKTPEEMLASLKEVKIMTNIEAKAILKRIWDALSDEENTFESVDALFMSIGISQSLFETASGILSQTTNIVLKREPNDVWVNQYNADLLRCWNANMDIQYVVDAYACVVYIISYISKAEREMGLLLDHAQKEAANDGNTDAKLALKRLGSVYLHNREISAQEAVFRVCNLRLKEGSRKVQFIPTVNPLRMSLPLKVLKSKQKSAELDESDMWMTSIVDRYKNRPEGDEFDDLCLASFCSEYRVLSKSEVSRVSDENRRQPVVTLQKGFGHVQKRSRTEPAVVRYARFSPVKDAEKHYHSIMQLFLPYRTDSQLKPDTFHSYEEFYQTGSVQIGNLPVEAVKEIVKRNKALFEKDADQIEEAEKLIEQSVPLEDAWAQICPETESERLECQQEKSETLNDEPEGQTDIEIPDLLKREKEPCKTELIPNVVSPEEAKNILRSLNDEQADIFYEVRKWCLDKKNGKNPEPFHLFITGGAGTGKSYVIKAICYDATRILERTQNNPDDISVLLVAPTGVAAFNINASTIHCAFSIGINVTLPYQPLGEEKINTLRSKLHSIHILIIDEISMVNHKLLEYIHFRLRQIKQTGDHSPFGKVSVIAVGDFQQLQPIYANPLCIGKHELDLWNDNFRIAVLTKIVRQKESAFAQLLNRLRTKKKSEPLEDCDIQMLKSRETGEDDPEALHIYATNAQCDEYNVKTLHTSCSDPISIEAQDYSRNPKTGRLEKKETPHSKVHNTVLPRNLTIAIGARVMLTTNLATKDGLVNGAFGTVSDISIGENEDFPSSIHVVFDNEKVGHKLRLEQDIRTGRTPIKPQEDIVANNGGSRRQFPLKLAWACTVHKVQGLTVPKAVVSLKKMWLPGQAYVALSRVTSLEGLIIEDFNESAIYCNEKIDEAVSAMPRFISTNEDNSDSQFTCTIMLQNIEGLQSHIKDLQCDKRFMEADFICLTETWLSHLQQTPFLDGYTFQHKPRSLSYKSSHKLILELKSQCHGGVGVYSKKRCEFLHLAVSDLEYTAFNVTEIRVSVAVIYRPKTYTLSLFNKNLLHLIHELDKVSTGTIIMGDFNENISVSSSVKRLMESNGFRQIVQESTTEGGTLIDHVYIKSLDNVSAQVLPTYFGYHESVKIRL